MIHYIASYKLIINDVKMYCYFIKNNGGKYMNNESELISVVIPTYNRIKTLPRALESVLSQTYSNLEVIVVDDGSTDSTEQYIASLGDSRIVYVKNMNSMGPSSARNIGAKIAKGKYIAFQDSDDEWCIDKLDKQMQVMRSMKGCKLVYCEIARWLDDRYLGELPSRNVPLSEKKGILFEYLLLFPLISTQTILVDRKSFIEFQFDEKLQALEDYEFSIRFSKRNIIGFVSEPLVKVYDTPNSVNKRWKEKIHTQVYILEEFYNEFVKRNLLTDKLIMIKREAEQYGCFDFFVEEIQRKNRLFVSPKEKDILTNILKPEMNEIQENAFKIDSYHKISHLKEAIERLYINIEKNEFVWNEQIEITLSDIEASLEDYADVFEIKTLLNKDFAQIKDKMAARNKDERLLLISLLYECCSKLEEYIASVIFECNVCNNLVVFKPISQYYENMRRNAGFIYWNATYQLESKTRYRCPICNSFDRDRLIIAFLDEIKPENNEKLNMLQFAPSKVIENWACDKDYINYSSTDLLMEDVTFKADIQDMHMINDEEYDIIVCSHVLEHVENDIKAIKELYRITKMNGFCIVLVPLIVGKNYTDEEWGNEESDNWRKFGQGDHARLYGKKDFINKLKKNGFIVNELGIDWFGKEYYDRHGFDDNSILYVLSKQEKLTEDVNERVKYEQIFKELQKENKLLSLALANISDLLTNMQKNINRRLNVNDLKIRNVGWEINDERYKSNLWYPKIMSVEDTIDDIILNKKSIARFGDGEFAIIAGISRWRFQKVDAELAMRLKEVLLSNEENILIGLIDFYGDLSTWTEDAAMGARGYLSPAIREEHYALLKREKIYANTSMSRNESWERVEHQKKIWDGRDCVFVEGYQTRMGIGNDLFDNTKSIVRILCPSENAFDKYEMIYTEALKQPKDRLILIALGPTATVLAYDLAKAGYQAIDIGHADISYEWLLRGKTNGDKAEVPYKYNNEVFNGFIVEDIIDDKYQAQIIADFH